MATTTKISSADASLVRQTLKYLVKQNLKETLQNIVLQHINSNLDEIVENVVKDISIETYRTLFKEELQVRVLYGKVGD